jgi:hypothetical protein
VGPQPAFVGADLNEVADMLIRRFVDQVKPAT